MIAIVLLLCVSVVCRVQSYIRSTFTAQNSVLQSSPILPASFLHKTFHQASNNDKSSDSFVQTHPLISLSMKKMQDNKSRNYAPWMKPIHGKKSYLESTSLQTITSDSNISTEKVYAPWTKKIVDSSDIPSTSVETLIAKVDQSIEKTKNFEDSYVECLSEGSSVQRRTLPDQQDILASTLQSASNTKERNFEDDSTYCTSEGGSWKVLGYNLPDFSSSSTSTSTLNSGTFNRIKKTDEAFNMESILHDISARVSLAYELSQIESNALGVVQLCDMLEKNSLSFDNIDRWLITTRRSFVLGDMLKENRENYINTVSFLGNRIPRNELPNLQNIPYPNYPKQNKLSKQSTEYIDDCLLPNVQYNESILDKILLSIFRGIVRKEIKWESPTSGIRGLLEEGKHYMLSEEGTPENQHQFVKNSLAGLLTPFLPPFYRLFMAGIIPSRKRKDPEWLVSIFDSIRSSMPDSIKDRMYPGAQLGPWFYAPFLTSFVTPPFLSFLVGPSRINLRKDGQLGGMVVEKCKFLQESGCKGLCLHQCKLPAQEFFSDTLGVPLTVHPNFETQECQWSWGEVPVSPELDPDFPTGCLVGCPTKEEIKKTKNIRKATICSV